MSDIIAERLVALCRRYRIDLVYVFGSRAQEIVRRIKSEGPPAAQTASDVDIGVLPGPGVVYDSREKVRLMADLEDLLDVGRVDLVILPEAPPFLAVDIIRGELLYEVNPDRSAEYELYVLRRAGDLAPFERERITQILMGTSV
ncbi:MAG: nucleotidyltransferase domain-containing protein [Nitrospirales bacterium]